MNVITKVIAPAAIVFAAFSANAAGVIELDYPLVQSSQVQAQDHQGPARMQVQQQAAERIGGTGLVEIDYPATHSREHAAQGGKTRTSAEVRREAAEPRSFDFGTFA